MNWNNKDDVINMILTCGGDNLQYASNELKDDDNVISIACKKNGINLQYASDRLKNNTDIVLKACMNNGRALQFASDRLKDNKDIVLEAVSENGEALQYASNKLKNNMDIILEAINISSSVIDYIGDDLKKDKVFLAKYINDYDFSYIFEVSNELKEDNDFLSRCIFYDENPLFLFNYFEEYSYLMDSNDLKVVNKCYDFFLDYLEKTNFSLDYRIDVLRNMSKNELLVFLNERYNNGELDIELLDINNVFETK